MAQTTKRKTKPAEDPRGDQRSPAAQRVIMLRRVYDAFRKAGIDSYGDAFSDEEVNAIVARELVIPPMVLELLYWRSSREPRISFARINELERWMADNDVHPVDIVGAEYCAPAAKEA